MLIFNRVRVLFRIFIKRSYLFKQGCLFRRAGINNFRLNVNEDSDES